MFCCFYCSAKLLYKTTIVVRKIVIVFLFLSTICYSQKDSLRWLRYSTYLAAGVAEGYGDVLQFHYHKFQNIHPNANPQYWNPQISWRRKWKNGDPNQGEDFFLSSTALVWTRDGWHNAKFMKNIHLFGGLCIPIQRGKKWWWYLKEGAICYAANRAGFNLIYNGIYR